MAKSKRSWWEIILTCVSGVAFAFLLWGMWGHNEQIGAMLERAEPDRLIVATVALIVVFFMDAFGWVLIIRLISNDQYSTWRLCRVWMLSSLSRYLPGGVWPYASRVILAREQGVGVEISALSLLIETVLLSSSALIVGIPAVMRISDFGGALYAMVLVALLGVVGLHPRMVSMLKLIPGRVGEALSEMKHVPYPKILLLLIYYILFWSIFGLLLAQVAQSLGIELDNLHAVSIFALAFFLGFIAVFAPGGLGVREGSMFVLLFPLVGSGEALMLSVGSRIWVMFGELLSVVIAILVPWCSGLLSKIRQAQ